MPEWKMLVALVEKGTYTNDKKTYPTQALSSADQDFIEAAFGTTAHAATGHNLVEIVGGVVPTTKFSFKIEVIRVPRELTWRAGIETEKSSPGMPTHDSMHRRYIEWATDIGGDLGAQMFERLTWADHVAIAFPRPPNDIDNKDGGEFVLANATWLGFGGKPLIGRMLIPFVPGNGAGWTTEMAANIVLHEWLHVVDYFLQHHFKADAETVSRWHTTNPAPPPPPALPDTVDDIIFVVGPSPGARPKQRDLTRTVDAHGKQETTTQWDPHLFETYLHEAFHDRPMKRVFPRIEVTIPPTTPTGPPTKQPAVVFDDAQRETELRKMYLDQVLRCEDQHWAAKLGRPDTSLGLAGPIFGGKAEDWTAVEKTAISALLAHLPPAFIQHLSKEGDVRIIKAPHDEAQSRQGWFVEGTTIYLDTKKPPATPLELQKRVLAELARVYLRKRVGSARIRDQLKAFPWSLGEGLPFWSRVADDFATTFAALTPWKVHDRDCSPVLIIVWALFKLFAWKEPDGFWGNATFGAWIGLHHDDAAAFCTETPPKDVYEDFADCVVVYVFGPAAYATDGKVSRALPEKKRTFLAQHVFDGRAYPVKAIPVPPGPLTKTMTMSIASVASRAGHAHRADAIDHGPAESTEATIHDFFATRGHLRVVPGAGPPVEPALAAALAQWDAARDDSPTRAMNELQAILQRMPKGERVDSELGSFRYFEGFGAGLQSLDELESGVQRLDMLFLKDHRTAVVLAADAKGVATRLLFTDPAPGYLYKLANAIDPNLVRYVWRPEPTARKWAPAIDAAMRYLVSCSFRDHDEKYDRPLERIEGWFEVALRELLQPDRDRALFPDHVVDWTAALHAFMERRGTGIQPPDDLGPGDFVWPTGGKFLGLVDRVEKSLLRSVLAGGPGLPGGGKGVAPVKSLRPDELAFAWRPSMERRRWTGTGEAVPPLYADLDAALDHVLAHIGANVVVRNGELVGIGHCRSGILLRLAIEGGGSPEATRELAEVTVETDVDALRRVLATRGDGVEAYVAGRAIPRGSLIWFHDRTLSGGAPAVALVVDVRDGLPTKAVFHGAFSGKDGVLVFRTTPIEAAAIKALWVPTAAPRMFVSDPQQYASFYGNANEAIAQAHRFIGSEYADGLRLQDPIDFVRLLAYRAPEGIRTALANCEDGGLPKLFDTLGAGLEPPASPPPIGAIFLHRDGRAGVVTSLAGDRLNALVSSSRLAEARGILPSDLAWWWQPSSEPRRWTDPALASADYVDVNKFIAVLRRYEGYAELSSQYIRTPEGLIDSALFQESAHVAPSLANRFDRINWSTSKLRDICNVMHAQGVGIMPPDSPVAVGDFLIWERELGIVINADGGKPLRAMRTGAKLRIEAPPERLGLVGVWRPDARPRAWSQPGEPVSAVYLDLGRFLSRMVAWIGFEDVPPAKLIHEEMLTSEAVSPELRDKLSVPIRYGSESNAEVWKGVGALGSGVVAYGTLPVASGDFLRVQGDQLAVVVQASDASGRPLAVRTGRSVSLTAVETKDVTGHWRPSI